MNIHVWKSATARINITAETLRQPATSLSEVWPAQIAEIDTMDPPSKQLTPRRPSGSGPATATKVRDFLRYSLPWSGCGVCLSVNDYISTLGFNYKQIDR